MIRIYSSFWILIANLWCRYAAEEETVIHFLCQCQSLARCWYKLFGSPTFVSLAKLSSINVVYHSLGLVLQRRMAVHWIYSPLIIVSLMELSYRAIYCVVSWVRDWYSTSVKLCSETNFFSFQLKAWHWRKWILK